MTHTPGPWKIRKMFYSDDKPGWEVLAENGEHITGWGKVTQTESNARLIAAAPQQHKTLKSALSLVDLIAGYAEDMPAEVLTTALATGQQIEQALAAAIGEEQR